MTITEVIFDAHFLISPSGVLEFVAYRNLTEDEQAANIKEFCLDAGYREIKDYPISNYETDSLRTFFRTNPEVVCTEGTVADLNDVDDCAKPDHVHLELGDEIDILIDHDDDEQSSVTVDYTCAVIAIYVHSHRRYVVVNQTCEDFNARIDSDDAES